MGINQSWHTTNSFRKFRRKTHELSRVYWTHQLGIDAIKQMLKGKAVNEQITAIVPSSFEAKMHYQTVEEFKLWQLKCMQRTRLQMLVMYTGFLEAYIKEITFYFTLTKGYVANPDEELNELNLNEIGTALTRPILQSSTVPTMLEYAEKYFNVQFGDNLVNWNKIYKIRCLAAHNGGTATSKFLDQINGYKLELNPKEHESIGITWNELRKAMRFGDEIAATIDIKVANNEIKFYEVENLVRFLKRKKQLPPHKTLWTFIDEKFHHASSIGKDNRNKILMKFYGLKAVV